MNIEQAKIAVFILSEFHPDDMRGISNTSSAEKLVWCRHGQISYHFSSMPEVIRHVKEKGVFDK